MNSVWIVGQGDISGEWEIISVHTTQVGAEAAARNIPGFFISDTGQYKTRDSTGCQNSWINITQHNVIE